MIESPRVEILAHPPRLHDLGDLLGQLRQAGSGILDIIELGGTLAKKSWIVRGCIPAGPSPCTVISSLFGRERWTSAASARLACGVCRWTLPLHARNRATRSYGSIWGTRSARGCGCSIDLLHAQPDDVDDCSNRLPVPKLHAYADHYFSAINGLARGWTAACTSSP